MTNIELQELLSKYPNDMPVKLFCDPMKNLKVMDYQDDFLTIHSNTVYADDSVPEEEWDTEDGKHMLGDGEKFLVMNCPVF